nr:glycosyltransferase family 39 protein [Komagataeibacter sp. FNDCF1]
MYPLVLLACARLVVAGLLPLSPDEAYYRVWALAPAASYLDHPPMVAVWIRLGMLLVGDSAAGVRLVGVLAGCGLSFFVFRAVRDFVPDASPGRAGRACLLLQATLALAIQSVVITPDVPVLFFVSMLAWCMGRIVAGAGKRWWWSAGAAAGLAFDSKYTAVLPIAGIGLWLGLRVAWGQGPWVRRQMGGIAGALALGVLMASPVVWWNARHDWISFARQGGRTADWHPGRAFQFLMELVGGQLGLMTPGIAIFFAGGLVFALRRARTTPGAALLACMTCVPACVFAQHALGDRVQANWPVVIYPLLAVGTAGLGWRWGAWAAGGGIVMGGAVYVQALLAPLPLSAHADVALRQMAGWQELATRIGAVARTGDFIAACDYGTAAELATVLPGRTVLGMEPRWALFSLPHGATGEGIMVCNPRRDFARADFASVQPLGMVMRGRRGRAAEPEGLYRVRLRTDLPAARQQFIARLPVVPARRSWKGF